jgi:hypothetical protein
VAKSKDAQLNLRLPAELDRWLERRAGSKRAKPGFIRSLLVRERAREEERQLQSMFDEAWDSLSAEERAAVTAEREGWLDAYARRDQP